MGWHECEYISREDAKALGLRHADFANSSGDVTLSFQSGRSWVMPDMILLYVEIGWIPPQSFVADVINSQLVADRRIQFRGRSPEIVPIGYLNPEDDPIPKPFKINDTLPDGFLGKLEAHVMQVSSMGGPSWSDIFSNKTRDEISQKLSAVMKTQCFESSNRICL